MKSMEELFHALLQDVYFAEKKLLVVLPKLAKKSSSAELERAFLNHLKETEGHVKRLEKVFGLIGKKPKGKTCDAILGIVAEGEEVMKEAKDETVRDAGIIAAAQAAEHYEIARYGTLCEWAKTMGLSEVKTILGQTLDEEEKADEHLTRIAEGGVNQAATREAA